MLSYPIYGGFWYPLLSLILVVSLAMLDCMNYNPITNLFLLEMLFVAHPLKAERGIWKWWASVRPRYVVSALRFLFVDQFISNLQTSIILGISSLSSKLGKIRKKIVRMTAIFKMSAKTHQNFKVLQFQRKLIFRGFST